MSSIVVSPKNKEERLFLTQLLKKLGIDSKVLSDEDTEDIGLSILMKGSDRNDVVEEAEIQRKLKR